MTALTTESRAALASALTGLGLRVYDTVPATPVPPCLVIIPDSPWLVPDRIGSNLNYTCRWRLLAVISPRQNAAAQIDTENAVDAILGALPSPYAVESVGQPSLADTGAQGTVITTEITVSVKMKE